MGWTIEPYYHNSVEDYFDHYMESWEGKEWASDGKLVNGREYYRAMRDIESGNYICFIALIDRHSFKHSIAVKTFCETSMPYYFNCPETVFNIISQSETENEHAKEWRKNVMKVLENRKKARELEEGVLIKFDHVLCFGSFSADTFRLASYKKRKRRIKCFETKEGFYCQIRNWRKMNFEIVEEW